jgi:hypothetical protein
MHNMQINLGSLSESEFDLVLQKSGAIPDISARIEFLSRRFLGTSYRESTLIGDIVIPEELVVNLEGVDCFTFIDYIEAMRLSGSFSGFMDNLKRVRYKSGSVSFENRNHFFSDWKEFNSGFVHDITEEVGGLKANKILKTLNRKEDGSYLIPGTAPVEREISYIPSPAIDGPVLEKIRTGDYIGIYSRAAGLDVSHVGIFIREGEKSYLRHASSQPEFRKVIDQDFQVYIQNKPGIIIFRPLMYYPHLS